jgi:hypothetical protein
LQQTLCDYALRIQRTSLQCVVNLHVRQMFTDKILLYDSSNIKIGSGMVQSANDYRSHKINFLSHLSPVRLNDQLDSVLFTNLVGFANMLPQINQAPVRIKKVLVLYVGGTIGMERNENHGKLKFYQSGARAKLVYLFHKRDGFQTFWQINNNNVNLNRVVDLLILHHNTNLRAFC